MTGKGKAPDPVAQADVPPGASDPVSAPPASGTTSAQLPAAEGEAAGPSRPAAEDQAGAAQATAADAASDPSPPVARKVDPETAVLRAQPPRAVRFRRDVVIAGAALASISLVAISWMALKPRVFAVVSQGDAAGEPAKAPADALSGLAATYGDAPRLGPKLPGDLGRPILAHQQAMATASGVDDAQQAEQAAQAERERRAAELKAARESGLMVQSGNRSIETSGPADAVFPSVVTPGEPAEVALDPERDPNAQQRKAEFVAARDKDGDINPHTLVPPASPYMLSAGSVISASLITGLRSDLPGLVTAQVTSPVFDSATGRILLIPQGARLIGSYDSVVAFGQKRALVVWQRIILPDGSSLRIDTVPATDAAGHAGLADRVDFHTWALLKGVALSTLLGVGANLTFSGESDLVQAIRESTQQNGARAGDQLTSRNLQIQPTITIRPGTPVRLVAHRDLILARWKE